MSIATTQKHFGSTPAAKPKSLLGRIGSVLGLAVEMERQAANELITGYESLVTRLAECEIDSSEVAPKPEIVRQVCLAAGKSIQELESDVLAKVDVAKLHQLVAADADAPAELADVRRRIDEHQAEFDRVMTSMRAKGDQLQAEERDARLRADAFRSNQAKLAGIVAAPDDAELAIVAEIQQLIRRENDLRAQAGRSTLAEHFINTPMESCSQSLELRAVENRLAAIEADGGEETRKYQKLVGRRDELTQWLAAHSRLYKLGESIRTTRQKVSELRAKREQLRSARERSTVPA